MTVTLTQENIKTISYILYALCLVLLIYYRILIIMLFQNTINSILGIELSYL